MRRIWKDQTILMLCVTVFLSYLPEAGQYSCFFVYLRLVMDFSKVIFVISIPFPFIAIIFPINNYIIIDFAILVILGGRSYVYRSGRNLVSYCPNWSIDLFDENIGIKAYNYGWTGF